MNSKVAYFPLQGGEDLVSPPLTVKPGRARYSLNYECDIANRYKRVEGFERIDGQPAPSDATYNLLYFSDGSQEPQEGETIEGATSSATAEVLSVVLSSGSFTGSDAAGYVVVTQVTGTFEAAETLEISAVSVATLTSTSTSIADADLDDTYLSAAQEAARDKIEAVPGSGDILGVWSFNNTRYAIRNNAGATAAVMYKSSTSGWTACDLGEYLEFTTGTAAFAEEETVSEGGVSATVKAVVVTDGTWTGGDAEGYLVIYDRTGGDFSAGAITGSVSGAATASGAQVANAFTAGGRFEFVNHNFTGTSSGKRMFGCDGKSLPFQWDGSTFVPIFTGSTGYPEHITAHRQHLFLSYPGGSMQHSGIGEPLSWSAGAGASEIGVGSEIRGILSMIGILAILTADQILILYGSSTTDWELKEHSTSSGAIAYTIQEIGGRAVFLSLRGILDLSTVREYGDFRANTISRDVQPLIDSKKGAAIASVRVRAKDQYRVFFSDGTGINLTIGGGFTRLGYGVTMTCACSVQDSDEEVLLFGDGDGFVYQMEKGDTFDGTDVEAVLLLPLNHFGSPSHKKRFRRVIIECDLVTEMYVAPEFSYGDSSVPSSLGWDLDVSAGQGALWNAENWNEFYWSEQIVGEGHAHIDGVGRNIALFLSSTGGPSHILQGVLIHYDLRGLQR